MTKIINNTHHDDLILDRKFIQKTCLFFVLLCISSLLWAKPPTEEEGTQTQPDESALSTYILPQFSSSNFPEEVIDLQTGKFNLQHVDVHIPGPNGLDVNLVRRKGHSVFFHKSLGAGGWYLDIPLIKTYDFQGVPIRQAKGFCKGKQLDSYQVFLPYGKQLSPVGYPNSFNGGTTFSDNSILTCPNGRPVLKTSDGRTISFSSTNTLNVRHNDYYTTYLPSSIVDRFGNEIRYEYTTFNYRLNGKYRSYKLLSKIISPDNVEVIFHYQDKTNYPILSKISYLNKEIIYGYEQTPAGTEILSSVTNEADQVTSYKYRYQTMIGGYKIAELKSMTTTQGAKASYQFETYIGIHGSVHATKRRIKSKTISGPHIKTRNFTYNYTFGTYQKVTQVTEADYLLGQNRSYKFTYKVVENTPDNASSGYFALNGQLLSERLMLGTTLLYKRSNNWTYKKWGEFGCKKISTSNSYYLQCARANLNKVTKTVYQSDGTDVFVEKYSAYNMFGVPGITESYFSSQDSKRYIKQSYVHDTDNWLINLPSTTALSSDGSTYIEVSKTTYKKTSATDGTSYTNQSVADKQYRFGKWVQEYKAYDNQGNISLIEFNAPLTHTGATGNRYEKYTSYKHGQPQSTTIPKRISSGTMLFAQTINSNGWITDETDLNGNKTYYTYDGVGRLSSIDPVNTQWADTLITWRVNASGQPLKTTTRCTLNTAKNACASSELLKKEITYDNLLRPVQVKTTDMTNNLTRYITSRYNVDNQVTFTSYPSYYAANTTTGTTYVYDGLQRLLSASQSGGGTVGTVYLSGNKIKVTDAGKNTSNTQHSTTTTYLAYGAPSYEQATKIISPENVTTDITINVFGNTTAITQSGFNGSTAISQTEYRAYDSQKRLCQIKRDDVGTTVIKRNTLGEALWQAQGQTALSNTTCNSTASTNTKVSFGYDNLGEQHTISYGDGTPTRTFTLDNNGNIKTITSDGFNQSYNYNSVNLLEDESLAIDGKTLTFDYDYSRLASLSSFKYPNGTEKVNFAPNGFGQATKAIRTKADNSTDVFVKAGASYYPNGMVDSFTYGNNVAHKTTLNNRNMPEQITDKFGTSDRVNLSYNYDNNNNITAITNTRDGGIYSLSNLTYDGLDRLQTTTGGSGIGSSSLTYDGLGNIRSYSNTSVFDAHSLTYGYSTSNRLNGVSGIGSTGYNFNRTDSYDTRGNVTHNGKRSFNYNTANQMISSGNSTFVYDGYNRRIKSVKDDGKVEYSMYSQSGKLLYRETDQGGINYIFLGSKLVAKEGTGIVSQGDSIMNYKPFGDSIEEPKDDVGYTGHKFDTDLGLSYMQARYYDPVIGRFNQPDPIGVRDVHSFNRYAYANNNPYRYIDPDGRACVSANGTTTCSPENKDFGEFSFPTPKGWTDFKPGDSGFHKYTFSDSGGGASQSSLKKELIKSPTNDVNAATQKGALNDVGPLIDIGIADSGKDNVKSYTTSDGIANVTEANHVVGSGFVVRKITSAGNILTYGEGNSRLQTLPTAEGRAKSFWTENAKIIVNRATK